MNLRNINLKTISKILTSNASTIAALLGSAVPDGMIRWVTFVSFQPAQGGIATASKASKCGIYLASCTTGTKASIVATANRKALWYVRATQSSGRSLPVRIPTSNTLDTPLFSIAGGKKLYATATGTTMLVNLQYFEE